MQPSCKAHLNSLGLLILRAGVGGYMLTHGWGKVGMLREGKFDMMGDPIGLGNHASLYLATFAEFVCSILVILGLGTRLATIPLITTMCVAAFVVHRADPWTMETAAIAFFKGETKFPAAKEVPLLYLVPFLTLLFTGPGRFSLDALLFRRRAKPAPAA